MSLETWVSVSTLIVGVITICAVMFRMFANLNTKIDHNRIELNTKIDLNRDELNARLDRTDAKLDRTDAKLDILDERVYELATRRLGRSLIVPPAH